MWLLQGRFAEDSRQEQIKLFKYGQTYTLGRKIPADIVIDSKFVSRISCHITVASSDTISSAFANVNHPLAFHNDPALRPRVTIRFEANKSRKTFAVSQAPRRANSEPTQVQVLADSDHALNDGDSFALTTTISLRLVWKPMAVCFAAKVKENAIAPFRKAALEYGIHLSSAKSRWKDGYTHLCLAQVKPTESVLCALLQARPVVTIEYFAELFRRAELPRHDPASLETSFDDLDYASYQPPIDENELKEILDMPQKLLPNEKRTYMLRGTTCIFFALPHEESELAIYKSLLGVAGARVFTHNPQAERLQTKADFAQLLMPYKNSSLTYWRNSGSKARSEAPDEGLAVLISAVHENQAWKEDCAVACTNLRIAMPTGFHAITNAVFSADVRANLNIIPSVSGGQAEASARQEQAAVESATDVAASAPEQGAAADNTVIEPARQRQSQPVATPSRIEAAGASTIAPVAEQQPSFAITAPTAPPSTASEPQRRPLTRRTRKPTNNTEDTHAHPATERERADATVDENNESSIDTRPDNRSAKPSAESTASQLTRAERSGLTRRTGTSRTARRSNIFDAMLRPDGSVAAAVGDGAGSIANDAIGASLDAGSFVPKSRRYRMDLDEEDKAQTQASAPSQVSGSVGVPDSSAAKRKSPPSRQASDTHQDESTKRTRTTAPETAPADSIPSSQAPAPEPARINGAQSSVQSSGLAPGTEADSEPTFLQALNTQRAKGKKMDEFDAEFNRLQIAKPGTQSGTLRNFVGSSSAPGKQKRAQAGAGGTQIDEDYEAFKEMAEEELRIHVRGNFVQVDFVPLVRQKKEMQPMRGAHTGNVPNFKKFRPKGGPPKAATQIAASGQSHKIALVLPEGNDYGLGQSYWEEQQSARTSETITSSRGDQSGRRGGVGVSDDDDEQVASSVHLRGKSARRDRVTLDPSSVEGATVDLDLDGLDSMESEDEADMTTMMLRRHGPQSQRSSATSTAAAANANAIATGGVRGKKRPAPPIVQESDEEMVSPAPASASARKRRAPTRTAAMVLYDDENDDDDDGINGDEGNSGDDGNFAGFGKSSTTRRRRVEAGVASSGGVSRATRRALF
ncbi:uncharacterized protein MEPE_01089 [Melanopsichium pennsylvanicum]|uniref:FHA domain-containing protein n=2 Tax=Melanopsichium pennsylvanicum TaxID=63383 RepID=A0AAJ4XHU6_9BASI|nr:nibrin [Melanopsichium pennsylvanicum 4]SNX82383.1 uncharacterized protein MEPE_01089 [Melanopsichium pennsylvanicum]